MKDTLCVAMVLLLLKLNVRKGSKPANSAFIRFRDYTGPFNGVERATGCGGIRWSTDN